MKNTSSNPLFVLQIKDKESLIEIVRSHLEKCTGKTYSQLKNQYCEEQLFCLALDYLVITKKALCKSLELEIDNSCRTKRKYEKQGLLVQSRDKVVCPYSKNRAHLITMNKSVFELLLVSKSNQLKLF